MDLDLQAARAIHSSVAEWVNLMGAGVSRATFAGFDGEKRFLVQLDDAADPRPSLSTVRLAEEDVGAKIVVAFENGDMSHPIIVGRLQEKQATAVGHTLKLDGERLVLRAERDIELRCGEASLILTRAGKILIRGNYVLTRSRGANKIKGAFVDIN